MSSLASLYVYLISLISLPVGSSILSSTTSLICSWSIGSWQDYHQIFWYQHEEQLVVTKVCISSLCCNHFQYPPLTLHLWASFASCQLSFLAVFKSILGLLIWSMVVKSGSLILKFLVRYLPMLSSVSTPLMWCM